MGKGGSRDGVGRCGGDGRSDAALAGAGSGAGSESDQLTSVPATAGCSRWNRSVHSHPDGCKETTYCMVLGPRRDGLVVSFFSFRCRGVYLARLQAFLAPGYNTCSCFGGSCQGKAQRDCLVIPSCVLKCRPAIVFLTHVLRYPGAQIPDSILL